MNYNFTVTVPLCCIYCCPLFYSLLPFALFYLLFLFVLSATARCFIPCSVCFICFWFICCCSLFCLPLPFVLSAVRVWFISCCFLFYLLLPFVLSAITSSTGKILFNEGSTLWTIVSISTMLFTPDWPRTSQFPGLTFDSQEDVTACWYRSRAENDTMRPLVPPIHKVSSRSATAVRASRKPAPRRHSI